MPVDDHHVPTTWSKVIEWRDAEDAIACAETGWLCLGQESPTHQVGEPLFCPVMVSINGGIPNGWFIMENAIKKDDLRVPPI